jgi:hypothetical protein
MEEDDGRVRAGAVGEDEFGGEGGFGAFEREAAPLHGEK